MVLCRASQRPLVLLNHLRILLLQVEMDLEIQECTITAPFHSITTSDRPKPGNAMKGGWISEVSGLELDSNLGEHSLGSRASLSPIERGWVQSLPPLSESVRQRAVNVSIGD